MTTYFGKEPKILFWLADRLALSMLKRSLGFQPSGPYNYLDQASRLTCSQELGK